MSDDDIEKREATEEWWPEKWSADEYRDAEQALGWNQSGYDIRDVVAGDVPLGESVEVFGFHLTPTTETGEYIAQADGYVKPAAEFDVSDIENALQLADRLHRLSALVFEELSDAERKRVFKVVTRDPDRAADDADLLYVPQFQHDSSVGGDALGESDAGP